MSLFYAAKGQLQRSRRMYEDMLPYLKQKGTASRVINTQLKLSTVYQRMNLFEKARELLQSIIYESKQLQDSIQVSRVYLNLGFLMEKQGRFRTQIQYGFSSIKWMPTKRNNLVWISRVNLLLGNAHYHFNNLDSAGHYYKKSMLTADEYGDRFLLNKARFNLGRVAEKQKEFASARTLMLDAYTFWKHEGDTTNLIIALLDLGHLYGQCNKPDSTIFYLEKNEEYFGSNLSVFKRLDWFDLLSKAYAEINEFDTAYYFKTQAKNLQDSVSQQVKRSMQNELDVVAQNHRIEQLKAEGLRKQNKYMNSIVLIIIAVFVIIVLMGVLLLYRQKNRRIVAEKEREIQKKQINELLKNQELSSIMNVLEVQEHERRRIAQDLHDRLGSMLSMVKLHFKNTEKNLTDIQQQNRVEYEKAAELLDSACDEVRKIAHNLISGVLRKFGLAAALQDLKQTIEQTKQLNLDLVITGLDERLGWEYELNIYRIIQELLANTMKHAEATEVTLQLLYNNQSLVIVYEDDGRGFNPDKVDIGMGTKNIASRLEKLGGKMELDTGKGGGTTYTFDISIRKNEEDKGFTS